MLVVVTSHPIQYQAPLWRALADYKTTGLQDDGRGGGTPFEVWFLTDQGVRRTKDRDFGKAFAWDVDLLSGYPHRFLELRRKWDMRKFNGIPLARPIGESLREAGATALWVEGWRFKAFWDAVSAAKKMGIPVFLRGETSDKIAEKAGLLGLVRNFALHRLFAKVDYFLAIGQASRRFYLTHGVPERKLVDAPYGVDNEFFRSESRRIRGRSALASVAANDCGVTRESIRKGWKIPSNAKVVMFCGKFVRKKRPLDLVEAAALRMRHTADGMRQTEETGAKRQATETKPWHLLFVGSGELGGELRAACSVAYDAERASDERSAPQSGGGPPASFAGFLNQSEISKAYAVADVVVLPSEAWETWGLVVNEATASGVPTVVSDQCGCADDFAASNPYTRVFPVGDIPKLAAAIESMLAAVVDPEQVAHAAEAFSPRLTAEAVVALFARRGRSA